MFGMSLGEIFIIVIIAILFVGPDKLPDALVKIAKFFRSVKGTINEAKESFDQELQIKELKEEALNYKKQLMATTTDVKDDAGLSKLDDIYEEFNSINKSLTLDDEEVVLKDDLKESDKPKKKKKKKKKEKKLEEDKDV